MFQVRDAILLENFWERDEGDMIFNEKDRSKPDLRSNPMEDAFRVFHKPLEHPPVLGSHCPQSPRSRGPTVYHLNSSSRNLI